MCQRVYLASQIALPVVRRGRQSPSLEVTPVAEGREVRSLLRADLPYLYLAGGHVECGCGFPSETAEGQPDPKTLEQADVASLAALAEYVRACGKLVQVYLCWAGQEGEGPVTERSVTIDDLRKAGCRLKHQEILTVAPTVEERRRRTKG